ncbi:MAG: hypothetical protein NVSMB6_08110 [Burkholderiaceae bacterium]
MQRKVAAPVVRAAWIIVTIVVTGCASLAQPGGTSRRAAIPVIAGKGVTLYAAGDIADCRKRTFDRSGAARTAVLIEAGINDDPHAVVAALGDTTYPAGRSVEFTDCYAPTWGRFKSRTLPAPGNHEYYTSGASGYFDYFGAQAGPGRRGYYSTEVGTWHVVSLNSALQSPASDAQLKWLIDDLARARRASARGCILAFWHHPLYSSGGHGNNPHMRRIWQALVMADADVVLTGHDHDYERFSPQDADANLDLRHGIRAFVIGVGGAELTPFTTTKPHSVAQDNTSHGVLKMELKPDGYEWALIPVDGGEPRDPGSARCH